MKNIPNTYISLIILFFAIHTPLWLGLTPVAYFIFYVLFFIVSINIVKDLNYILSGDELETDYGYIITSFLIITTVVVSVPLFFEHVFGLWVDPNYYLYIHLITTIPAIIKLLISKGEE